jgi:hypothetical protein
MLVGLDFTSRGSLQHLHDLLARLEASSPRSSSGTRSIGRRARRLGGDSCPIVPVAVITTGIQLVALPTQSFASCAGVTTAPLRTSDPCSCRE